MPSLTCLSSATTRKPKLEHRLSSEFQFRKLERLQMGTEFHAPRDEHEFLRLGALWDRPMETIAAGPVDLLFLALIKR